MPVTEIPLLLPVLAMLNWSWLASLLVAPMATVRLPPFHMPAPPKSGAPVTVTVPLSTVTSTLLTAGSAGGSGPSSVSVGVPLLVTVTALVAAAGAWVAPL